MKKFCVSKYALIVFLSFFVVNHVHSMEDASRRVGRYHDVMNQYRDSITNLGRAFVLYGVGSISLALSYFLIDDDVGRIGLGSVAGSTMIIGAIWGVKSRYKFYKANKLESQQTAVAV